MQHRTMSFFEYALLLQMQAQQGATLWQKEPQNFLACRDGQACGLQPPAPRCYSWPSNKSVLSSESRTALHLQLAAWLSTHFWLVLVLHCSA